MVNLILRLTGMTQLATVLSIGLAVAVSVFRNELTIYLARTDLPDVLIRGIVYGVAIIATIGGIHFNVWIAKKVKRLTPGVKEGYGDDAE